MLDHATVATWLEAYSHAWQTYDATEIGALFSEDAVYYYHPFAEPVRGREAIVASWLGKSCLDLTHTSWRKVRERKGSPGFRADISSTKRTPFRA